MEPTVAERTRRRVTRRLIPYLTFIYLLAYLDRANLGVAKLHMQGDLHFTDEIVGFGAGIFFLGFLLFDIPGTLIVERWSARKWLSRIMISWGIVATSMGFLGTSLFGSFSLTGQFYTLRLLLGCAEAGFFPGVVVYLSHWFRREDRARAMAYFMVTQPVAIALGVPVSRWILENVHWRGVDGWRWVFILEGLPSVIFGVVTLFFLTDRPHQAGWLPDDEKSWLMDELKVEEREKVALGRVSLLAGFRHPQTLLLIAVYFLMVNGNQAMIFFLPSIADNMKGISVSARTIVAAVPYACSVVGILLNGISAGRSGERRWHTALPMISAGTALSLAMLSGDHLAFVIGFYCLTGMAAQAYLPVIWTLPSTFLGKSAAAASVGLISLGNLGGFSGPYIFGYLRTATGRFETGIWFLAGCMIMAGALASLIRAPGHAKQNAT